MTGSSTMKETIVIAINRSGHIRHTTTLRDGYFKIDALQINDVY